MKRLQVVTTYQESLQNAREFNNLDAEKHKTVFNVLASFYHWYYFPELDSFAPSKFIGYANSTLAAYEGGPNGNLNTGRTGTKTEEALEEFFVEVDRQTETFKALRARLDYFLKRFHKKVSKRLMSDGGIHVPREWNPQSLQTNRPMENAATEVAESESSEFSKHLISDDYESAKAEGKALFRLHRRLERDSQILRKAKRKRLNDRHELTCDACSFDFTATYGELGEGFIEGHHTTPISQLDGETRTKVSDIALLCANCHRMIHRRPAMSVADLRELVEQRRHSL